MPRQRKEVSSLTETLDSPWAVWLLWQRPLCIHFLVCEGKQRTSSTAPENPGIF